MKYAVVTKPDLKYEVYLTLDEAVEKQMTLMLEGKEAGIWKQVGQNGEIYWWRVA